MSLVARVARLERRAPRPKRVLPDDPAGFVRAIIDRGLRFDELDDEHRSKVARLAAVLVQTRLEREQLGSGGAGAGRLAVSTPAAGDSRGR